jgi:hypothetical protein
MGLVLMHRSVVEKLREKFGKDSFLFSENSMKGDKFIGEDISFFRKCKETKIPVYANTAAIAQHMKTTPWDIDLYNFYWNNKK